MSTNADDIDASKVQWDDAPIDASKVQWDTAPAKTTYNPTEGMSNYDKFMAGAGKAPVDIWHGVKQLFGQESQADVDERANLDRPLMKTGAGLAGNVAGNVGTIVASGGLAAEGAGALGLGRTAAALSGIANPTTFGGMAATGALQGGLAPVETGQNRAFNAGAGAVASMAGGAVARGATNLVAPVADAASRAVQALTDAGVPLDAAQRSGSILLQRAKAMLSDNPITAGAQADFQDMQKRAFTKAALSTIGEKENAATPEVMGRAMSRIGGVYDDVASRVSIPYDHIEPKLADIENQARLQLNDSQFAVVQRNLNDIVQKASGNGGVIDGPQFSNLKKTLDNISGGSDSDVGEVARDIRRTLNDGLLNSAAASGNATDVQALKTANQQWGNMRKIEGAISKDGNGQISPASLASTMYQKANRYVSIYGKGDSSLVDLANAGNELLPNKTPNSGSPARLMAQFAVPAALGAGVEGVREGNWQGAAKGAAAGVIIPKLIQGALNSQGAVGALTKGAANLVRPAASSAVVAPGIVQHLPLSTLLAEQERLKGQDTSKPETQNNQ